MTDRRAFITSGLGLAGIIAAGRAPAALVRSAIAARQVAFGSGGERHKNTYLHFDGSSYIPFYPYFDNGGALAFSIEADAGLGYLNGNFNSYYLFDSSTGDVYSSAGLTLSVSRSATWYYNFKLNGNKSPAAYNPTTNGVIDQLILAAADYAVRGKFETGAKQFDGSYRCYVSYNGSVLHVGPTFAKIASQWTTFCNSSNYPRIGWTFYGSESFGIGAPSVFDLYSLTFAQGGEVLHRLIPALGRNSQGCLYDEIGKRFYTNAGTGVIALVGEPKYIQ